MMEVLRDIGVVLLCMVGIGFVLFCILACFAMVCGAQESSNEETAYRRAYNEKLARDTARLRAAGLLRD